jgi:diguanylate cyclase (GGDEF)-like protein/PAS domain S-box-containing protein
VDGDERSDLVRLATGQMTVGFALADARGALREVNAAMCRFLGRKESDLLGLGFEHVMARDELATELELAAELRAGSIDSFRRRARFVRPGGAEVHGDIAVSGVRDEDGRLIAYVAFLVDVTDEVQAQERLRALIDTMLDPWVLMEAMRDEDGRVVDFVYRDANSAACRYNGLEHDELVGRTLLDLLPAHLGELLDEYAAVVDTGVPLVRDDAPYPDPVTGAVRYFDNRGVKAGDAISFTWRDVTDRVERREALARQARQDPLTGLANRAGLLESIAAAVEHAPRQGVQIAVLYCDVDGLKTVNDTYGHRVGDHLLRAVADRMAGAVRRDDLVARIGGDEFVVMATGITDDEAALGLAGKVAEAVSRPLAVDGGTALLPRISIGVAMAREGQSADDVLAAADRALYRQKRPQG